MGATWRIAPPCLASWRPAQIVAASLSRCSDLPRVLLPDDPTRCPPEGGTTAVESYVLTGSLAQRASSSDSARTQTLRQAGATKSRTSRAHTGARSPSSGRHADVRWRSRRGAEPVGRRLPALRGRSATRRPVDRGTPRGHASARALYQRTTEQHSRNSPLGTSGSSPGALRTHASEPLSPAPHPRLFPASIRSVAGIGRLAPAHRRPLGPLSGPSLRSSLRGCAVRCSRSRRIDAACAAPIPRPKIPTHFSAGPRNGPSHLTMERFACGHPTRDHCSHLGSLPWIQGLGPKAGTPPRVRSLPRTQDRTSLGVFASSGFDDSRLARDFARSPLSFLAVPRRPRPEPQGLNRRSSRRPLARNVSPS